MHALTKSIKVNGVTFLCSHVHVCCTSDGVIEKLARAKLCKKLKPVSNSDYFRQF